ncbi:MAG: isoprenyl transferase [Paludibacteraceae bacterium]|nr:isoprenyl transferase [Paludibacteraceae bacterium]
MSIDMNRIPAHVAIIMDGNGRWAKKQGRERLYGHMNGVESVRAVLETAVEIGVKWLTLYTFSTENWNRPKEEVDGLMNLLMENLVKELPTFHKNNVRLKAIGERSKLPERARELLENCEKETSEHDRTTLVLALSYSSRWEITEMTRRVATMAASGELKPENITAETVSQNLATREMPDPDLLIRTSGEYRLSNFMMWQLSYSEMIFTDTLWPDFRRNEFMKCIEEYQGRERRYGKTSEQMRGK